MKYKEQWLMEDHQHHNNPCTPSTACSNPQPPAQLAIPSAQLGQVSPLN